MMFATSSRRMSVCQFVSWPGFRFGEEYKDALFDMFAAARNSV